MGEVVNTPEGRPPNRGGMESVPAPRRDGCNSGKRGHHILNSPLVAFEMLERDGSKERRLELTGSTC